MCSANVIDDHGPIVSDGDQVLCEVPPQNTCQDGLCLPDTTAATCIYQSGEAQCRGEVYTARTVVYQSFDDDRRCTDCSCTAEGGCNGLIEFTATCGGPRGTTLPVGECAAIDGLGPTAAVRVLDSDAPLECVDEGGEPDGGGVSGTEPITTCCVP